MHQICRQLSRLPEICWSSMAFSSFVRKNCSAAGGVKCVANNARIMLNQVDTLADPTMADCFEAALGRPLIATSLQG